MQLEPFDLITPEDLYLLAGNCFAAHLGYPTFNSYIKSCTYFYADLSDSNMVEFHLSEPSAQLLGALMPSTYEEYLGLIKSIIIDPERSDNIGRLFDRKRLCVVFKLGESFVSADFSCSIAGQQFRKRISCVISRRDEHICGVFLVSDVTDIYTASSRLIQKVDYDGLTGLLNRTACDAKCDEYLKQYPYEDSVLLVVDIDHFKRFNDQFGHEIGDMVLCAASRQLEQAFGKDGIIGRSGGDEFIVLLKNRSAEAAEEELREFGGQSHSIEVGGKRYSFTFSIGYALHPLHADNYTELKSRADTAMYYLKLNGRGSHIKFSDEMLSLKRTALSFNLVDIIEGIPGAIIVYKADEGEEILFANPQLYDLFECESMEELLKFSGDSFRNIVHPDDLDRVESEIARQIGRENSDSTDYVSYRIVTKKRHVRWVEDIGRLVHDPKYGDVFYVFLYDKSKRDNLCD